MKPIYYAITPLLGKDWSGFVTEEVGHDYQDLCSFAATESCVGGLSIDSTGKVTHYTASQLEDDYIDESMSEAERAYEQLISDRELFREGRA